MNKPLYYELTCHRQAYDWGNPDPRGLIPSLLRAAGREPGSGPFAELWMGAHPSLPSQLQDGRALNAAVQSDPGHFLGSRLAGHTTSLPFLFKILDAKRPLSIQAHPDAALAKRLHERDPDHYPDPNHKPELAVALDAMSALIGFKSPADVERLLSRSPQAAAFFELPGAAKQNDRVWLKERYSSVMRAGDTFIQALVQDMKLVVHPSIPEDRLFLQLAGLFGESDAGIFSAYFLNYVELKPGQALFLGPNEPHAYLSGRILECMAASDNVVRAGLTTKFRDNDTLLSMLHYRSGPPRILWPTADRTGRTRYAVPVPDFEVSRIDIRPDAPAKLAEGRPLIILILQGKVQLALGGNPRKTTDHAFGAGSVIFLPGDLEERGIRAWLSGEGTVFEAGTGNLN
ncbi:MAG: mannose-6-phosphate isomerase, class I [Spirochaetia bacterium]|nr:mannose-6-phosphate isomerase, class I [Spirochaetia bacterium]